MSITNHGAVGALIAIAIKQPILALPIALLSHFVLDALPHFGYAGKDFGDNGFGEALGHKLTLVEEAFSIPAFVVPMILLAPFGWVAYVGAAIAISPDVAWVIRYVFYERTGKPPKPDGPIIHFHQAIQWCERPWGVAVEVPFSVSLLYLIYNIRP